MVEIGLVSYAFVDGSSSLVKLPRTVDVPDPLPLAAKVELLLSSSRGRRLPATDGGVGPDRVALRTRVGEREVSDTSERTGTVGLLPDVWKKAETEGDLVVLPWV